MAYTTDVEMAGRGHLDSSVTTTFVTLTIGTSLERDTSGYFRSS